MRMAHLARHGRHVQQRQLQPTPLHVQTALEDLVRVVSVVSVVSECEYSTIRTFSKRSKV